MTNSLFNFEEHNFHIPTVFVRGNIKKSNPSISLWINNDDKLEIDNENIKKLITDKKEDILCKII